MKRITRSLLSLCLALVLCAALLPAGLTARAAGENAASAGTSYLVTGYSADAYSIETNQTVNVAVSLSRVNGGGTPVRVVRGVDSFRGGYADNVNIGTNNTATFILYNLSYSGTGNSLSFTVYYQNDDGSDAGNQTFDLTLNECVPYTKPEEPEPVAIPAPRAVFSSDASSASPIAAGETKLITLYVQNAGTTVMRSPMLTLSFSGELMQLDGQSAYTLDDIRPGQSASVLVSVKAADKITAQSQSIDTSLAFYYDNGTSLTEGSSAGKVNVSAKITEEKKDEETIASPTPIVILSKYNYGGSSIAAGSSANLSFGFTNTSKKIKIENVMVTVTGGADLMLNGSTNTFYFESVGAGSSKTVTVPMKAAQLISSSAQEVQIAITYEYVDQNSRKSGSANLSLSVPLYQPDRFEMSEPTTSYVGYVGEETSLTIDYVNKGKSAINNVEATISGDVDTPTAYQRVGTIDGGKNGTIAFAVTPQLEGENQVKIVVSYEDSNGNTKERVFEATVEAMAYEPIDPVDPDMPIDPEPANTFPWKYVIIAAVVLLIVVLIVVRARKKKAKQKAEQALWDKWDEEEIAEEKKEAAAAEAKEPAAAGAEEQKK